MQPDYDELAARLEGYRPTTTAQPVATAVEVREFLTLQIPPRRYLLSPVLPEQGLMMVHGPRGLGKTHLSVGIAVAVSSGGSFLRWQADRPSPVLLIDGE